MHYGDPSTSREDGSDWGRKTPARNTMSVYRYLEPTLFYTTKPMWVKGLEERLCCSVHPQAHEMMCCCKGKGKGTGGRRESGVRVEAEPGVT